MSADSAETAWLLVDFLERHGARVAVNDDGDVEMDVSGVVTSCGPFTREQLTHVVLPTLNNELRLVVLSRQVKH